MTSGEWIGVAAFLVGIIGTVFGAVYGAKKNTQAEVAQTKADAAEETRIQELRFARHDREIFDDFLRVGKRLADALEALGGLPEGLKDHAAALRYLAMSQK